MLVYERGELTKKQVFNQEFIVDERYNVTKELGQGAYGIVWYDSSDGEIHDEC